MINNIEIYAHLTKLALPCLRMAPLDHFLTSMDNTTVVVCIKRGSVITASAVGDPPT